MNIDQGGRNCVVGLKPIAVIGILCGICSSTPIARCAEPGTAPVRRLALLVGVGRYRHLPAAEQMDGCANDVAAMRETLVSRFGFPPADVVTLIDEQATQAAIREAMQRLTEQVGRLPSGCAARIVFHFSGHGSQIADEPKGSPDCDEEDGLDETLVPHDALAQGGEQDLRGTMLVIGREDSRATEAPLAHARVVEAGLWESVVELYRPKPDSAAESLPSSELCRVIEAGIVPTALRLHIDAGSRPTTDVTADRERAWPPGVEVVPAARDADLSLLSNDTTWVLPDVVDARVVGRTTTSIDDPLFFGQVDRLLERQLRVRRLLSLATSASSQNGEGDFAALRCTLQPLIFENTYDLTSRPLEAARRPLQDDVVVAFEIANQGATAVDVTLLFVSAEEELQPLYPPLGREGDARLPAGRTLRTSRAVVEAPQVGKEHLLLIAVSADGAPRTFTWIAEEPAAWNRQVVGAVRGGADGPSALVRETLLGNATTRGKSGSEFQLQKLTWRIEPRER